MTTELEFLDGVGSKDIAPNIEACDRHVPCIDDLVYLDRNGNLEPFRIVEQAFYLTDSRPDSRRKISLYCEPFDKERDSFIR